MTEKKSFKCEICKKDFALKSNFDKHTQSVHKGEKPFKCNLCAKAFNRKDILNHHIKVVHEGKKPFKCETCNKSFGYSQGLRTHIATGQIFSNDETNKTAIKTLEFFFF